MPIREAPFNMKTGCIIKGCDCKHYAKGICRKHYMRLHRGGNPHVASCKELSFEARFRNKLGTQDPATGCIEWTAGHTEKGYGHMWRAGKTVLSHRIAYELKNGPIPEGMKVCHTCDNPPCCNEEHLFLGTNADNMSDMVAKGRSARGEKHGEAKLTYTDVVKIRQQLEAGVKTRDIAASFGVSKATVRRIKIKESWKLEHDL